MKANKLFNDEPEVCDSADAQRQYVIRDAGEIASPRWLDLSFKWVMRFLGAALVIMVMGMVGRLVWEIFMAGWNLF